MKVKFINMICAFIITLFTGIPLYGQQNYALQFDGSDDYAVVGNPEFYNVDQFTLEMWVKLNPTQMSSGLVTFGRVLDERFATAVDNNKIHYTQDWSPGDGDGPLEISNTLELNTWYHCSVTHTGSLVTLYIDGALEAHTEFDTPSNFSSDYGIYFSRQIGGGQEYLNGFLDEVRIWDYARSQQQLNITMDNYLSGSEDGLIGYWRCNEGVGQTLDDLSINVSGQLIKMLVDERYDVGNHSVSWGGKDSKGMIVGSGVYIYQLHVGAQVETRKLVLIR